MPGEAHDTAALRAGPMILGRGKVVPAVGAHDADAFHRRQQEKIKTDLRMFVAANDDLSVAINMHDVSITRRVMLMPL